MMAVFRLGKVGAILLAGFVFSVQEVAGAGVQLEQTGKMATLRLDGSPFVLKGAAGVTHLDTLAQAGATSVRTYGDDQIAVLDQAQKVGLKVVQGLWMEHPRRGFSYADPAQVAAQTERLLGVVEKYKNHPSLLIWGLGNEIETEVDDPRPLWAAVEEMAKKIKAIDPSHPVMLTVAEIGNDKVRQIIEACPSIDILGVNTYGDAVLSLGERLEAQGWSKPVIVTELGPLGQWQAVRTPWGAPLEPTSSEKAERMKHLYKEASRTIPNLLGVYPFYWGDKQEQTATWHGMLLADGHRLGVVDILTEIWTGALPEQRVPVVGTLAVEGVEDSRNVRLPAGSVRRVSLPVFHSRPDGLRFIWSVSSEATDLRTGGDIERAPPVHSDVVASLADGAAVLNVPDVPGAYRLFVTVLDDNGGAATANIPFLVEEKK